MFVFIE